jgi:hypothetical protein
MLIYATNFFVLKVVLSLDSQLTDFGRVMRLLILYLGRTISSKTQAKLGRLASTKLHQQVSARHVVSDWQ